MQHRDYGESLVRKFLAEQVQRLGQLDPSERDDMVDAVRQLGAAWEAHRTAGSEQDRTRALREVDAAMADIDVLAERVLAAHSDEVLARALRTLRI
jgi:hypothetical protein